jgi:hypothetical protein
MLSQKGSPENRVPEWVIHVITPSQHVRFASRADIRPGGSRVSSPSSRSRTRRRAARSICQQPFDTLACVCLKGSVELIRQIDVDRDKPDAQQGRRGLSIAPLRRIRHD